ncbi:MAG: glycoside hydrolase family 38 C-terminal domain-containing protein [Candidatus Hatepunaea meridiana]|nr:glycoside hydrolase family 38 C-terminal domain-containing protein [Candidatus Hatepunaea meridiana]
MDKKTLFLICNAHLDPVWLWQWEEGVAETLSTFRTAARFCEEFDGFVFCHNEALLYQWVETYEPELFEKIRKLVKEGKYSNASDYAVNRGGLTAGNAVLQGKWHIMGGWFLQPDCNMPSGESFVRQILIGKRYFIEKFGVEPTTAVNFDPFGHSRGLVQILKKSGYLSYLFCRPDEKWLHLPDDDFVWVGYDGSEILAHRAPDHYHSEAGKACKRIEKWLDKNSDRETGLLLWGIGNHGGGPSREDLEQIENLKANEKTWIIKHGTPEDYFKWLESKKEALPHFAGDLNPWAVGCYTSMIKVKQKHRLLENRYYSTEKMVTNAALQGLIAYPREELSQSLKDLLFCEFHDILPGSSIPEVESYTLQRLDHGLEIISRLRTKAFFSLLSGHTPALEGEFPIFVYNPHPYDIEETIVCEFQPLEPNFNPDMFLLPDINDCNGNSIPLQLEKESSNILVDQRKRVVFNANLKAASMNRFSCYLKEVEKSTEQKVRVKTDRFRFKSDTCEVVINKETGLMDVYRANGIDYLNTQAFKFLVIKNSPDAWGMKVRSFRDVIGAFTLMTEKEAAEFAGIDRPELKPAHIIEDGPIRTVVEALFKYNHSSLCLRYKIPKRGNEMEIEVRVYWMEKDKMLKLSVPTCFQKGKCRGQVAYGVEEFDRYGEELVAQKWISVVSSDQKKALTVINNGTYGFDFENGELRLSLLRSPAYSGHPAGGDMTIVHQDRFEPRIDQGESSFTFRINAGSADDRLSRIDREALVKNEFPMALCCYPSGTGKEAYQGVTLSDNVVQLTTLKMAEEGDKLIIRLFEPTGKMCKTRVTIPYLDMNFDVVLKGFEIKTLAVDVQSKTFIEVDLLERKQ